MAATARDRASSSNNERERVTSSHSPFPHIWNAAIAASRVVLIQRDLAMLNAELAAAKQAKKAGLGAAALIVLYLGLSLGAFWATWMLHEQGWKAMSIAVVSFVTCLVLAGVLVFAAMQIGKDDSSE